MGLGETVNDCFGNPNCDCEECEMHGSCKFEVLLTRIEI